MRGRGEGGRRGGVCYDIFLNLSAPLKNNYPPSFPAPLFEGNNNMFEPLFFFWGGGRGAEDIMKRLAMFDEEFFYHNECGIVFITIE